MEDQFGGRTDDDLFYDDFEPVESAPVVIDEAPKPEPPAPKPESQAPPAVAAPVSQPKKPVAAAQTSTPSSVQPHRSLASSRWADKPATTTTATATATATTRTRTTTTAASRPTPPASSQVDVVAAVPSPPANAPTAPASSSHKQQPQQQQEQPAPSAPYAPSASPPQNTAANAESRLKSGANPRQKLTDAELAAKMAEMKLLAAEKTRKFEMAEKDEKQHAQAYARGMEEARRRRAEDAERRRRGDEERRKLDDERARNRERKLKAIGMKEGGWDEGKEVLAEQEARRGFRGANGGVRGARSGAAHGGLAGSRYARDVEEPDVDRFLDDRSRSRGHGRGARGGNAGGSRGRGGARQGQDGGPLPAKGNTRAPLLTADEFPSLPSDGKPKTESVARSQLPPVPALSTPPPGGKWDDEMEALDELKQGGQS